MIEIKTAGLDALLDGSGAKQRFLIFGTPGSGKTPFAAQFPKPIFLMADRNGPDSLVLTKTPYIEVRSEKAAHEAIDALYKETLKPNRRFETVVLDTYSVLQKHIVQEILRREGKPNLDDFRQWGELGAVMAKILHRLHNLDMHVVVTVHTKDKFDTEELEPDLVGSAKQDLPKEFPNIGWLHTEWGVENVDGQDRKVVRRVVEWVSTPKMPLLRSTSALLPARTTVDFAPSDYAQLEAAFRDGAAGLAAAGAIAPAATEVVETETEQKAAPPDVAGGPVNPKPDALPKARKKKGDDPLPSALRDGKTVEQLALEAPAEQTTEGAVALIEQELGGQVIADGPSDPIAEAIEAVTDPEAFTALWRENKAAWTPEHSALVKTRKAALAGA